MSAVAGLLSQSNASQSLDSKGDLVGEYQETIFVRNAKGMNAGSTLFGLMSRLKAESAENTEFNWFERDPVRRTLFAEANATAVTTGTTGVSGTIVVHATSGGSDTDAWVHLTTGHIIRNDRTGELMRVTADPTTNTVTVLRAIQGGNAAFTILTSDSLVIITLAKDEGANPVRAAYEEPDVLTNYIQTFNATVELTNAFKANKLRSDAAGPLKARRVQALEKISKDIEMALLIGFKQRVAGTNGYIYTTGGIKDAVDRLAAAGGTNNALNGLSGTGVSLAVFNTWLQGFMTVGSDAKLALCGPQAYAAISNFANSASNGFRIMNQETVYGMNITVINTPFGELDLAFHPLLKEIPAFSDWMFVADLAHIMQKTMEPLFLEANIQTPGQDSYKEQFRAKLGLKLRFAEAFGYAQDLRLINAS